MGDELLNKGFPLAMHPPEGDVVVIDAGLLSEAIAMSRKSPRGRIILRLHKTDDDPLQRMLNVLQPGSYIQPHRHLSTPKAESIVVLKGSIGYVAFEDNGHVSRTFTLAAGSPRIGIDTGAVVYHTFFALENDTVLFEVKPGPYFPDQDKDFAPWAPGEGSADASQRYLAGLYKLFKAE